MDVIVISAGANAWHLRDELGRHLGDIKRASVNALIVAPGRLLSDLHLGPFMSLALAMSEIAREAHGTCHLAEEM